MSSNQPERPPRREVKFKYIVPLIYAPLLPTIRIAFRKQPRVRSVLWWGGLSAAFAHGAYLLLFDLPKDA
eukprot:m.328440 g.328440  ORF g.328440 m.328440 type:complete len:70 (-) comp54963_c0_seq1:62-271(-)